MNGSALPEAMPALAGPNPFVGPRPFEPGERLYGREREIGELHFRLNAERIVLLHSPSGAGKSSLVQAGLLPLLGRSFDVWGPTRVNAEPAMEGANRYALSAIQGFEEGVPAKLRRPVEVLARQTLAGYFEKRPRRRSATPNVLLVFDQFEEILTVDPLAIEAKHEFFDQLGELLRDPRVWALFALREDYLAPLDPYARQVPTHLKNRFRIDLLGLAAAREAMVEPARQGGREFPAVDEVVHDLATVKVQQPDGTFVEETGRHVEPVQLQVACRRLWDAMPPEDLSIDAEDLERFGDVTEALAAYYADSIGRIAAGDLACERAIRDWFGEALITAGGIRGQVLREAGASGGLANELIDPLRGTHLVRAEKRAGVTWYELAHDRLIEPVQSDNAAWREKHLADVQRRAALWERQGRPPGLLLAGAELAEGERWAAENSARITEVEGRFLAESRKAREIAEQERRQAQRIRRLAIAATVVGALALVACGFAAWQWRQAKKQARLAKEQATLAIDQAKLARKERKNADEQKESAEQERRKADQKSHEAVQAKKEADAASAEAVRQKEVAQQERDGARRAAARAHVEQAENLIASGRRREALVYLAQAVRLAPENSATRGRVFALLLDLGSPVPNSPLHHEKGVNTASFSPDGQRIVTASKDGTARTWDAVTGEPLGQPMEHRGDVYSASFSPDGLRIVTASEDGTAQLWDASTGQPLGQPMPHEFIRSASFSPSDGRRVVTASRGKTARLWDGLTGEPLGQPMEHQGEVRSASFSPDGLRVVTASGDKTAQLWNGLTGERLGAPMPHGAAVGSASFSPDGERAVTASEDGTARLWIAMTGGSTGEPMKHPDKVTSASFSPDGRRVVTASGYSAWLWDGATGKLEVKMTRNRGLATTWHLWVTDASFSPDGKRVLTASNDGSAQLWDAATGKPVGEPMVHADTVSSASFSPEGKRLVTASADKTARLWDASTSNEMMPTLLRGDRFSSFVRPASFSPDGRRVVASADRELWLWDAVTAKAAWKPLPHDREVISASFSPDGQRVVTACRDGAAHLWAAVTGKRWGRPLRHFPASPATWGPGPWVSASFNPNGRQLLTLGDDGTARLWNATTGRPLAELRRGSERVSSASFSPDGRRVATASFDGTVWLWDASTGQPWGKPLRVGSPVVLAAFSPDGQRVLTASEDGTAILWEAFTGNRLFKLPRDEAGLSSATFSADSQRLVTTSSSRTARLWDVRTGKPLGQPLVHDGPVNSASFSRDGQRVVTASEDGMARLWDSSTGKLLGALRDGAAMGSASFSPDGQRVLVTGGTVRVWDALTGSAAEAEALVEVAEVVGGFSMTELGNLEPIPPREHRERIAALRRLGERAPDHQPTVASFLRWYFTPRLERTISPLSKMTVEEYIRTLLALGTEEARREAEEAFPGHPLLAPGAG